MSWKQTLAYNQYAATEPTAAETNAELEREWARLQREGEARRVEAQRQADIRLEVTAIGLYEQLGRAVGGITTEPSWCDLADQIEALVDRQELSSRHAKALHDRMERVARDRGWLKA
jgi:hypothetical protein